MFRSPLPDLPCLSELGISLGGLIGFGISFLTQRFDIPLVEQSLTLVSAYGTYIVAEELGGSGVIAVVTTGLILGNFGSRIGMNPANAPSCFRVLGIFSLFCELHCVLADWRPGSFSVAD